MEIENINIHSLPSLKIPERYNLPKIGAVYFVLTETGDVEYIGKAKNLNKRWRKHECCIDLDSPKTCRVVWFEVSGENERIEFEKQFIRKFSPKLNVNFIVKPPKPKPVFVAKNTKWLDLITVKEAADLLGVTVGRVHQFISEERLPAVKLGSQYTIKKSDLKLVKERKVGRPKKTEKTNEI